MGPPGGTMGPEGGPTEPVTAPTSTSGACASPASENADTSSAAINRMQMNRTEKLKPAALSKPCRRVAGGGGIEPVSLRYPPEITFSALPGFTGNLSGSLTITAILNSILTTTGYCCQVLFL